MGIAKFALISWIPLTLLAFSLMPARRAILLSFLGGWLFLPVFAIPLAGLPDYSKVTAASFSALIGAIIFDPGKTLSYRLKLADIPMLIFIFCPMASSLANDLGPWDGMSAIVERIITWGIPYWLGRVFFNDWISMRELAVGLAIAGLIYLPFFLLEVRISPQLHRWVYGYHQHQFAQTIRFGGFRPMVFMSHGLVVSMWMTCATLSALWLWKLGLCKRVWKIPMAWILPFMVISVVLTRSMNSYILFAGGGTCLWLLHRYNVIFPIVMLTCLVPSYVFVRLGTDVSTRPLVEVVGKYVSYDRAHSLNTRFFNERLVTSKALGRKWFGWGGWGRSRVYDDRGKDITVTDGLWIIVLGKNGLVGLVSMLAVFITPILTLWWCYPPWRWNQRFLASPLLLAILMLLLMVNNMFNSTTPAIFLLAMGAVNDLRRPEREFTRWNPYRRRIRKVRMV